MPGAALRIVDLQERDARVFPREELFDQRGRTLILPETRALPAIELREVFTGVELRARGLIGYLPLTAAIVLNLRPKFPIGNFWRLLAGSDEGYDRVLPVLRSYQRVDASAPPHQLLVRGYCHYLRAILSAGIPRGYFRELHLGHYRPKVDFGRTVGRYLSRGDEINVAAHAVNWTAGLQANARLKSACIDFLRVTPRAEAWAAERRVLMDGLNTLHSVDARRMAPGEEALASTVPLWLRPDYRGALEVYALLLGYKKAGFSFEAHGSAMPSFLFSLDDIFESFVRNTLRNGLRGEGVSVVDGNKPRHQRPLFSDNRQFPIKPDMILKREQAVAGIGETKYKPKITEADRYQVIAHTVSTGAPVGVWISPAELDHQAGMTYVGALGGAAKFYHYRLNISGDLDAACADMVAQVAALVPAP